MILRRIAKSIRTRGWFTFLLKRMYAELSLTHEATKDLIKKGW